MYTPVISSTTLRVYKLDKIIKRYKKNLNLIILSSKITIINDIISTLNTSKSNVLIPLKV